MGSFLRLVGSISVKSKLSLFFPGIPTIKLDGRKTLLTRVVDILDVFGVHESFLAPF